MSSAPLNRVAGYSNKRSALNQVCSATVRMYLGREPFQPESGTTRRIGQGYQNPERFSHLLPSSGNH
jgi:hypothetical protein